MALETRLDVRVDDDVEFELTVVNADTEPYAFTFRSGQAVEFEVYEGADPAVESTPVWAWGDGRMFTQQIRTERLAPGETLRHTGTWSDPPPGTYTVVGFLTATGTTARARATFEV